jgi:diaminopropionate ammonia-lyase
MSFHVCSSLGHPKSYKKDDQKLISVAGTRDVQALISQCPAYDPTPLHNLPGLASALGIGQLHYKDESFRFGLNAFKSLGSTYAVGMVLLNYLKTKTGQQHDFKTLAEGVYKGLVSDLTVTCASAGNHGRAVAAGARHFGCRSVIFLPNDAASEREQMIKETGAEVIRHSGNYDETLVVAEDMAREKEWIVVSDTAWPGYEEIPQTIMQGYAVMIAEVIDQLATQNANPPSHVLIQGGVGGVAAAVAGYLADRYGSDRPILIVVEPEAADCLFNSARQGELSHATGSLETFLGPLNCAVPSSVAWTLLENHADAFITITDEEARDIIERLQTPQLGDPIIHAGPAGSAGMAGLCQALASTELTAKLGFDEMSNVLVFGTEGALPS